MAAGTGTSTRHHEWFWRLARSCAWPIVENDHGSGCELRHQHLLDIGREGGTIHGPLDVNLAPMDDIPRRRK